MVAIQIKALNVDADEPFGPTVSEASAAINMRGIGEEIVNTNKSNPALELISDIFESSKKSLKRQKKRRQNLNECI